MDNSSPLWVKNVRTTEFLVRCAHDDKAWGRERMRDIKTATLAHEDVCFYFFLRYPAAVGRMQVQKLKSFLVFGTTGAFKLFVR